MTNLATAARAFGRLAAHFLIDPFIVPSLAFPPATREKGNLGRNLREIGKIMKIPGRQALLLITLFLFVLSLSSGSAVPSYQPQRWGKGSIKREGYNRISLGVLIRVRNRGGRAENKTEGQIWRNQWRSRFKSIYGQPYRTKRPHLESQSEHKTKTIVCATIGMNACGLMCNVVSLAHATAMDTCLRVSLVRRPINSISEIDYLTDGTLSAILRA